VKAYGGRILHVDLTTGAAGVEPLGEDAARALLGGNGLAARLLYDAVPAQADPFAPANAVVFGVGPITDTTVPGNSRALAAAKSPLTGLFFDSTFGGRWPATLKRTGFDAVVLTGRAAAPSYVVVDETGARLEPAAALWGRSTRDTVNALLAAEGGDTDAIAIGPAGERGVRFAALAHYWKNREAVAGRGGLGAVLGSKNVKAVVVKGARKTEIADAPALKALLDETPTPTRTIAHYVVAIAKLGGRAVAYQADVADYAAVGGMIDRIVADSRDVALNHTAGLSLPQQVMMTLFSLSEMMDGAKRYQQACMEIVHRRALAMIEGLGLQVTPNPLFDAYYGLIDFEFWARKNIGEDAVEYLKKNVHPLDLAFRLAEAHGIVLLNGGGFDAPDWSLRVSLANLADDVYDDIGRGVRSVARGYRDAFEASRGAKKE